MTIYQHVALASRPKGWPTLENFRYEDKELPEMGAGQVTLRTIWLSLDPYMRGRMNDAKSYADPVPIGGTMEGGAICEVIASNNDKFAVGDIVVGRTGWATHGIADGADIRKVDPNAAPLSTYLGVLGMPGMTAWIGLNEIGKMKEGETVLISAATGAVGGLAGQLAKAKGCKVIGVAGGAEKCSFAVDELGFDACLDHKAAKDGRELGAQIKEAAPQGVDVYFENVGGKTLEAVLPNMNMFGRIAICGMIAWYNGDNVAEAAPLPAVWSTILTNRLTVQGFLFPDHQDSAAAFFKEVAPMMAAGKIKFRESVAEGLENAPEAFLELLNGDNFGKQLVRVGEDPKG
ncbi:NADP-dependent oxidoreductase [Neptunicoccus cionae]|uniref:NADP-dependent oxidoreductase n=1 Tax=Neptunicoccus cionae TaxID=2035344 RepID=A0A916R222_9RHOB|nr:NADP-dependent oxidoreductase [Amylibacter cionae]GGA28158.1 NADP-dependent oxidoreductase [Amylibacter cionae]